MGIYVGIDLGTTFSMVSYIDEGGTPVVIPNNDGNTKTPSVVYFGQRDTLVGDMAKNEILDDGFSELDYVDFIKRHMSEPSFKVTTSKGESFRPEEISALILKKLKQDAEEFLGDSIAGAVITVPAYFATPQRQATKDAAAAAKIPVLGVIDEPTAAAYAFGLKKNISQKQRIMVYDFGGGTFDVTLCEIDNDQINILGTNGNHHLGGVDIDNVIIKYVEELAAEQGINIDSDPVAKHTLKLEAEKAKIRLSSASSAKVPLLVNGRKFSTELDIDDFEMMIEPVIVKTLGIVAQAFMETGLQPSDLDKILLVGGSTRIPLLRTILEEQYKIKPSSEVHPDEAVAIGAAHYALDLARVQPDPFQEETANIASEVVVNDIPKTQKPKKTYKLSDVTSHGIGIVIVDEKENRLNSVIMPKNTKKPAEVEEYYSTSDPWQETLLLEVTQGDSCELRGVTIIGSAEMKIEPRPERAPLKVIVSCDEDGIIHVRAIDLDKNLDLGEIKIDQSKYNMSEEEIQKATNRITTLNIGN